MVEVATHVSEQFLRDGGNDGLLGLAWPKLNSVSPRPVATPVENMISQNLLAIVRRFHNSEAQFTYLHV